MTGRRHAWRRACACAWLLSGPIAQASDLAQALRAAPSATAVLQARCDALSSGHLRMTAQQLHDRSAPALDVRHLLDVTPNAAVVLRHVRLRCGDAVLSEAWNWYVPDRLTPAMNETLTTTDIPFGRAVAATHFTRQRLESIALAPATHGGMTLQNTAVLHRSGDQAPISLVVERYDDRNQSPSRRPGQR